MPETYKIELPLVIETSDEWGLSFTNHNPEDADYFIMPNAETAFRLKEYLKNKLKGNTY